MPRSKDNLSMRRPYSVYLALFTTICLFACAVSFAKDFILPKPNPASTYPYRDVHPNEKTAMAADPYDTNEKAKLFDTDYREKGLLPIYFVVTNDGNEPVALANMRIQLVTRNRTKIEPSSEDDIVRRVSRVSRRGDEPRTIPVPIPRKAKAGVSKDTKRELENGLFRARAVEPKSTQAGFLFFDVEGIRDPIDGARLYITGVKDSQGQELMYFEIPFGPQ